MWTVKVTRSVVLFLSKYNAFVDTKMLSYVATKEIILSYIATIANDVRNELSH